MTTKESIIIVLEQYYDRRDFLREYRKNHRQDKIHSHEYYHYGCEMHELHNKINNLQKFAELF